MWKSRARKQRLQPTQVDVGVFLSGLQRLLSRTLGAHITTKIRVDKVLPRFIMTRVLVFSWDRQLEVPRR